MSPRDPRPASPPKPSRGVTVVVREPRPLEPRRAPEIPLPHAGPKVVVLPPGQPRAERDAFMRELIQRHGAFLRRLLRARRDVLEESAKDLEQRILLIVCRHFEAKGPPPNERGYLVSVMRRVIANHKRAFRPDVDPGAEVEAELSPATDPEGRAAAAEEWAHLERYLAALPEEEAEAVRAVDLHHLTLDEAAAVLGRPRSTLAAQRERGWDKLHELAQAPPAPRG